MQSGYMQGRSFHWQGLFFEQRDGLAETDLPYCFWSVDSLAFFISLEKIVPKYHTILSSTESGNLKLTNPDINSAIIDNMVA